MDLYLYLIGWIKKRVLGNFHRVVWFKGDWTFHLTLCESRFPLFSSKGRQFPFERWILFISWLVTPINFITIYFDLNLHHFWRPLIWFNLSTLKVYGVNRGFEHKLFSVNCNVFRERLRREKSLNYYQGMKDFKISWLIWHNITRIKLNDHKRKIENLKFYKSDVIPKCKDLNKLIWL